METSAAASTFLKARFDIFILLCFSWIVAYDGATPLTPEEDTGTYPRLVRPFPHQPGGVGSTKISPDVKRRQGWRLCSLAGVPN